MEHTTKPKVATAQDAARALAAAIQEAPAWRAWRHAEEALESDPEAAGLMARYRELAQRYHAAKSGGADLSGPETMELVEVQDRIQSNDIVRRRDESAAGMAELLREVNAVLSEQLAVNFAATAAPRRGGCC